MTRIKLEVIESLSFDEGTYKAALNTLAEQLIAMAIEDEEPRSRDSVRAVRERSEAYAHDALDAINGRIRELMVAAVADDEISEATAEFERGVDAGFEDVARSVRAKRREDR